MNVGTLTAMLKLDKSGFDQGVQESEGRFSGAASGIAKGARLARNAIIAVGVASAAAAFKTAAYGDEVAKTSAKMGVATETYPELASLGQ